MAGGTGEKTWSNKRCLPESSRPAVEGEKGAYK